MSAGRPRKFESNEERLAHYAMKARLRYAARKGTVIREYDNTTGAEAFRGTKAYRLYHSCKSRAKKLGLPFDLDVPYVQDMLNARDVCPLLDVPYDDGRYKQSVDKIIPELGYVKGNVWIISYRANSIKNDASLEELELITKNLRSRL